VAAAIDESRRAMNAVFFQLCKNTAVATDGHRLHALGIKSGHDGDFLVPRKAVELVENIRRATRASEVRVDFFEHQAVFHVGLFDVSVRLETEKFPAWRKSFRRSRSTSSGSGRRLCLRPSTASPRS
jgi:DNA polymerase III sliding clamp (beta) subunit (PCNA family)